MKNAFLLVTVLLVTSIFSPLMAQVKSVLDFDIVPKEDLAAWVDSYGFSNLDQLAERGDPVAQRRLARYYSIIRDDDYSAVKWLLKASKSKPGDYWAQRDLALHYHLGNGVDIDQKEALFWAVIAMKRALEKVGIEVFVMESVKGQDWANGYRAQWYTKDAPTGNKVSQFYLGEFFRKGLGGLPKDTDLAKKWYTASANQGFEPAKTYLKNLNTELSSSEKLDDETEYYEDGSIASITTYRDITQIIERKDFNKDGTLREHLIAIGTDGGHEKTVYHSNGEVELKYNLKDYRMHNILLMQDMNGNKLDFGSLKDGDGTFKRYTSEGVLSTITTYSYGYVRGPFTDLGKVEYNGVLYDYTTKGQKNSDGRVGDFITIVKKDGKKITLETATYDRNIPIKKKSYTIDGNIIQEFTQSHDTGIKEVTEYFADGNIQNKIIYQHPEKLLNIEIYKGPNGEDLEVGTLKDGNGTLHMYDDGKITGTLVFKDGYRVE